MTYRHALLAALALLLSACSGASDAAQCERIAGVRAGLCPVPVAERQAAPLDELPLVGAPDASASLEELQGRVVVVNFWASWCAPCREEQPDLNEAFAVLPAAEVAFLGVNIEDSASNAQIHVEEFAIPYPSLYDPANAYASRFDGVGPRTIPTTIFVDAEGRVAARVLGTITTAETIGLADAIASGT